MLAGVGLPRHLAAQVTPRGFAAEVQRSLSARAGVGPRVAPRARLIEGLPLTVRIPGGAPALQAAGLSAQPLSDDTALCPAPLGQILRVPGLLLVDPPRRLQPLLDVSVPLTGATALRGRTAVTGRGVMIAIVDSGLDLRHADFRRADGATRVRWLFDREAARGGRHPELPDYDGAAVYSAADIDAVLRAEAAGQPPPLPLTEEDPSGHGTHVAGIAAAGGLAAGGYVGMAPEAALCIAQVRRGAAYRDADVLTGVRFCLDRAREEGMPVVVNLSLGGLGGPHDGSTALEQALDDLLGERPGAALVVAAGNTAARDGHVGAYLLDGAVEVPLVLAQGDKAAKAELALDVYYEAGDLAVSLVSPAGRVVGPVPAGQERREELPDEGRVALVHAAAGARGEASLSIEGGTGLRPKAGTWRVRLAGRAARYDLWLGDATGDLGAHLVGGLDVDTQVVLPATARAALAVGALVSRVEWPNRAGAISRREREEPFAVAPFSAAGPSADGRLLPDVLAPGAFVVSTMSAAAPPTRPGSVFHYADDDNFLWARDGVHGVLQGTSQAAPHVTGAVALLFSIDPGLTQGRLREVLRTAARGPGYTPRQGFGGLDVDLAARLLGGERGVGPASAARSGVGVSRDLLPPADAAGVAVPLGLARTLVTVTPRDGAGVPLGPGRAVTLTATAGAWEGAVRDLGLGRYEQALRVHGLPAGSFVTIEAQVDGVVLAQHPRVLIGASRADAPHPAEPSAGCAVTGSGAPSPPGGASPVAVLAALLGLLRGARGRRRR